MEIQKQKISMIEMKIKLTGFVWQIKQLKTG